MNTEAFLADCRTEWSSFDSLTGLPRASCPRDRRLRDLRCHVQGLASENKLMLLNLAVRHLQPGEVYVEVGTWHGLSLAGALSDNPDAPAFACDNFSRLGSSRAALQRTIDRFTAPGQVQFFDMDFRKFLRQAPWQPARVGVYFYDGHHSFDDQFQALDLIVPWLADEALVVVDDTNDLPVRAANRLFVQHTSGFELLLDIRTPADRQPTWWNGIQVYRFRRAEFRQRPVSPAGYRARAIVWNRALVLLRRIRTLPLWWKHRR